MAKKNAPCIIFIDEMMPSDVSVVPVLPVVTTSESRL